MLMYGTDHWHVVCRSSLASVYTDSTICSVLDTFHAAICCHILYHYMVSNYLNVMAILSPVWCVFVSLFSDIFLTHPVGALSCVLPSPPQIFLVSRSAFPKVLVTITVSSPLPQLGQYNSTVSSLSATSLYGGTRDPLSFYSLIDEDALQLIRTTRISM